MPIAINGAVTTDAIAGATTPRPIAHTVPAGDNRLLVVCCHYEDSADDPTAVTFDGTPLTQVGATVVDQAATGLRSQMWYMVAPNVTTANINVTMTGQESDWCATALNYTGVDQTNPLLGSVGVNPATTANNLTVPYTSTVPGSLLLSCIAYGRGVASAYTALAGVTDRANYNDGIGTTLISAFVGERIEAVPGAYDIGATVAALDRYTAIGAEFSPVSAVQQQAAGEYGPWRKKVILPNGKVITVTSPAEYNHLAKRMLKRIERKEAPAPVVDTPKGVVITEVVAPAEPAVRDISGFVRRVDALNQDVLRYADYLRAWRDWQKMIAQADEDDAIALLLTVH